MTEELKPCPFCGSANLGAVLDDQGFSWTECLDCGAGGPDGDQSLRGMDWNTRAQQVTDEMVNRAARYMYSAFHGKSFEGYLVDARFILEAALQETKP